MKTRKIVIIALFIALSFIGANIKIMGTVAFDSMPGFLASLLIGPVYGAIIGAMGHFLTALTSGFPLSVPIHIIIMIAMALTMFLFGAFYKTFKNRNIYVAIALSTLVAVVVNGPLTIFAIVPIAGKGMLAMIPVLSLVALINIVVALLVYKFIPKKLVRLEK